ncbi:hypothetical protein [Brachybacterium sp. FME24]|uniref:hypothetical protein n=1 Tax=Brachybacterium sp. FME24 TaxID=2742605 RepID=UPI0018676CC8|nr:hypothetical protein [Brachybacterium sp. FME24]
MREQAWRRPGLLVGVGAALLVIFLIVLGGVLRGDKLPPGPPPESTGTPIERVDVEVRDDATLTVPGTGRAAVGSFEAAPGESYLMQFEVVTTKPEGSPGTAMYLGVSLNCSGTGGAGSGSIGGTQNLLTGEATTLRNQFVLGSTEGGPQSCNISVSAPNPEVAAQGTTIELDVRWTAQQVDGQLVEEESEKRLPTTVPVDGREIVFAHTLDLEDSRGRPLNILSSLHLTACTGVNGSRENGRDWCDAADVDAGGSEVDLILRADLLDDDGQVCGQIDVFSATVHIDRHTHHLLMTIDETVDVGQSACGVALRLTVTVADRGPAPVVVHGGASSFVVVDADNTGGGSSDG